MSRIVQALRAVTAKGERFYLDSKRVSRATFLDTKNAPGVRLDTFVTRATASAVRDWCCVRLPIQAPSS